MSSVLPSTKLKEIIMEEQTPVVLGYDSVVKYFVNRF